MRALAFAPIPSSVALVALSLAAGPIPQAAAQSARTVARTVALDARGEVVLSTFKGSVELTGWDRAEVRVDARIEPDGMPELVPLTDVHIRGDARRLAIESDYDRATDWHRRRNWDNTSLPFVHYKVRVPRSARITIDDHKSEIRLAGLRGAITLDTHKGRVRADGLEGPIRLSTHKGIADVRLARLSVGSEFDTHKGTITVGVPARAGFDLVAEVGRRGRLDTPPGLATQPGAAHRADNDDDDDQSVHTAVNGGGPRLSLTTHKGTLRVETR
jgi:hypothetical protein